MKRSPNKIADWFKRDPPVGTPYVAEELLKSVNLVVGLDQLLEILSAKLKELCHSDTVYLVLYEPITHRYVGRKAKGANDHLLSALSFSPSDRLIKWLNVNQCPLDVLRQPEVLKFLSVDEHELLEKLSITLVFPFIAVNRLTGAAFLSRKMSGASFQETEISQLMLLANHTALAIEHAVMYQFQEDRLKKLFHADKLATVGELAAGAAHEIRNPLTSIRSTVQYLQKDLPDDRRSLVDGIIEEVDRIDGIIKGLLSLSKSTDLQISEIDIGDVIHQTLLLLDSELRGHNIVVDENIQLADRRIAGDPAQLKQLFLNILLNSIQAMPGGGNIVIRLTHGDGTSVLSEGQSSVFVTIKDTGAGIPAADLPMVFDPFFTSKENGTGLGLSISYGIVSKHGGEIQIQSTTELPERGTTVTVRLPRNVDSRSEVQ